MQRSENAEQNGQARGGLAPRRHAPELTRR
jgi:hypothetical protein